MVRNRLPWIGLLLAGAAPLAFAQRAGPGGTPTLTGPVNVPKSAPPPKPFF